MWVCDDWVMQLMVCKWLVSYSALENIIFGIKKSTVPLLLRVQNLMSCWYDYTGAVSDTVLYADEKFTEIKHVLLTICLITL